VAFAARAFRTVLVCQTVRSSNDPRSISPEIGNLLINSDRSQLQFRSALQFPADRMVLAKRQRRRILRREGD
jgi:hypothetical protein